MVGPWWSLGALPAVSSCVRRARVWVPGAAARVRMEPSRARPAAGTLLAAGHRTLQGHGPLPPKAKCLLLSSGHQEMGWSLIGTC